MELVTHFCTKSNVIIALFMEFFIFVSQRLKHINNAFGDIMMEITNYYDKKVLSTGWSVCHNSDINFYAQNIVETLNALTETCVPK